MIRLGSVFALLLLSLPASVRAECTREERAVMARQGNDRAQIDKLCKLGEDDFPPPAAGTATYCETPQNFCPLAGPAPVGAGCSCPSPTGPLPGIAE
jgi:hypothetical protein